MIGDGVTRRTFGAGFLQGLLIAYHIRSADFFEFADRDIDEFAGLQHPCEAFRPQCEILRRVLALLFKDRKSVVSGTSVILHVGSGGRRIIKKTKTHETMIT